MRGVTGTWRQVWPALPVRCDLERVSHGLLPAAPAMMRSFRQHIDVRNQFYLHISEFVIDDEYVARWIDRGRVKKRGSLLLYDYESAHFIVSGGGRPYPHGSRYDLQGCVGEARVVYLSGTTRVDVDRDGGMVVFVNSERK